MSRSCVTSTHRSASTTAGWIRAASPCRRHRREAVTKVLFQASSRPYPGTQPPADDGGMTDKIVVGIDGSIGSRRALQWAANEAALRGAELVIVHAWHFPPGAYMPYVPSAVTATGMMEEGAEKLVAHAEASIAMPDQIRVRRVIVEGLAAALLLQQAADAD